MLRALILAAVALALVAGGASAEPSGGAPAALVAAERSSELVGVDLTTGRVIGRVRVPRGPHNVTSYGARYVLVTSPPAGAVTLVDGFTRRVLRTWRGFGYPHDVEVEGNYAYVTDERRGQLVVIDLTTRTIAARVAVGSRPHDVAVGDVALVTHNPGNPKLTVVDVRRPRASRVTGRLAVPAEGGAHDISEQPDSANVYVTGWGSGGVGAINSGSGRVLWWRNVGVLIHHVQFDYYHGRRLWVTDHRTGDVLALASRNGRVLRRLRGCAGAHHVTFGGTAWVVAACHDSDALAIWSQGSWKRRLVRVGDGPHGVAEVILP
ncbi:MAG TPA: YncE family protein [Gaiellaceae bacterium]|nr:YncE family protein [Gaiellaceae bacterium]